MRRRNERLRSAATATIHGACLIWIDSPATLSNPPWSLHIELLTCYPEVDSTNCGNRFTYYADAALLHYASVRQINVGREEIPVDGAANLRLVVAALLAASCFVTREIWIWRTLSKKGARAQAIVKTAWGKKGWLNVEYSFRTQSGDLVQGKDSWPKFRLGPLNESQTLSVLYSPLNPKFSRIDRGGFKHWWLWQ